MGEFIVGMIESGGYFGIIGLMILENVFPPIPSELILPFVGLLVANGTFSLPLAIISTTLGAIVGTSIWFAVGWVVGTERITNFLVRYGVYVSISIDDFNSATKFFKRFQIPAVFFGRMMPTVRSVISLPAGCIKMNPYLFLLYTTIGTLIWNTILIVAGSIMLNDYAKVERYLDPVTNTIIALFIALYVIQIIRFHFSRKTM